MVTFYLFFSIVCVRLYLVYYFLKFEKSHAYCTQTRHYEPLQTPASTPEKAINEKNTQEEHDPVTPPMKKHKNDDDIAKINSVVLDFSTKIHDLEVTFNKKEKINDYSCLTCLRNSMNTKVS